VNKSYQPPKSLEANDLGISTVEAVFLSMADGGSLILAADSLRIFN
jgi:hypothetical protein